MSQRAISYALGVFLGAFAVITGLGIGAPQPAGAALNDYSKDLWNPSQDPFVVALRPVLAAVGKGARISYAGLCQQNDSVRIPQVSIQPPTPGTAGLVAVREILQNDKNVVATEDTPGIIRITIGDFSKSILQTRISLLTLTPFEQYNGFIAVSAMARTSEMAAALRPLGLRLYPTVITGLLRPPPVGLPASVTDPTPHLPPSMSDVTVDQVLDTVAATFKGIVLYGACEQSGEIYILFIG